MRLELPEPDLDLLRRLSLAAGPPGAEDEVRAVVRGALEGLGTLEHDRLGSILCTRRGGDDLPRVVVDSHLDEVGFMVQSVSDEGRLAFVPLGAWWAHVLLGQRVDVLTERGRVPGVIASKPPHFLGAEERAKLLSIEAMSIDVGASSEAAARALGVRPGDPVVPHAEFAELAAEGVVAGKAFDNRVGVGLMCETMRALAAVGHPNTVVAVGSVQEELGARGARTASALAEPDAALVLEATPADDLPGISARQAVLGRGPQLRFSDPTALSNRRLLRRVETIAAEAGIEVQLAVRRGGGTDAQAVQAHGRGVPTVVVGVPTRYIHTHWAMMRWSDYVAARDLVVATVRALDRDTVESLVEFA